MGQYLKEWEAAKKTFAADAKQQLKLGGDDIPEQLRKELAFVLKADTGMTPALKVVDTAFDKKHRKAVMSALTDVHAVVEKVAPVLVKVSGHFMSASTKATDSNVGDVLNDLAVIVGTLNQALKNIETKITKGLESLQEEKSPEGKKILIISLEGDMVAAINKFKQAAKTHAVLEKQHQVLDKCKPVAKAMQAYSKAAARTQVKEALAYLEQFMQAVDDLESDCDKIAKLKPAPEKSYLDAIETLCGALRTIKKQRASISLKNLKQLEAEIA